MSSGIKSVYGQMVRKKDIGAPTLHQELEQVRERAQVREQPQYLLSLLELPPPLLQPLPPP